MQDFYVESLLAYLEEMGKSLESAYNFWYD